MKPPRCFEILELDADATLEEAAQAYRDLVAVWHPDRYGHNRRLQKKAERRLQEINAAYAQVKRCIEEGGSGSETAQDAGGRGSAAGRRPPPEWGFCAPRPRRRWPRVLLFFTLVSAVGSYAALNSPAGRQVQGKLYAAWDSLQNLISLGDRLGDAGLGGKGTVDVGQPLPTPTLEKAETEPRKPAARLRYEIHLNSGTVIGTASYREEGDMVYFRTAGGSMGLPREKVREIRRIAAP